MNKAQHTTRGIKHWGLSGYSSILPRIKYDVSGQGSSPQSPTISYRQTVIGKALRPDMNIIKFLLHTTILTIVTSCGDRPNDLNYIDIHDNNNNVICKYNPIDSNAIIYLDNNERYMIGKLINLKQEGVWKEYITEDNQLDFKWTFKNNVKDGIYFGYTLTGKIETVGHYKNDQLNGVLVYFDLKQNPEKVQVWKGLQNIDGASEMILEKKL